MMNTAMILNAERRLLSLRLLSSVSSLRTTTKRTLYPSSSSPSSSLQATTTTTRVSASASSFHTTTVIAKASTASSTTTTNSSTSNTNTAAFCHHGYHYEASMASLHGKQLALAELEGLGKDDEDFDPFLLDEMEDEELLQSVATLEGALPPDSISLDTQVDDDSDDQDENDYEEEVEEEEEEDDSGMVLYENNGAVRRSKSQLATLRAGAAAGGLFAVATFPDKTQHKVTTDDVVICSLLKPLSKYKVGSIHTIKGCGDYKDDDSSNGNILLVGSSHWTWVGMPLVPQAEVDFMVEEITLDKKIVVFHKRRRKNSQRKQGHRRRVSVVRILDIRAPKAPPIEAVDTPVSMESKKKGPSQDLDYYIPRLEPVLPPAA